jgi:hypothetical protein
VATLYLEELKASMRGRFAWLGAAVVLQFVVQSPDPVAERSAS